MAWYQRFVNLMRSERLSRDLEREMAFHLSERTDELIAGGLSAPEAIHEAQRRFGNRTLLKERTRDADVLVWLESLLADLRYAARGLRKSPGFALVAILSLGLGIGANTAIFSLIDTVMLKSLPVSHPEELVQVTVDDNDSLTNPVWEQLRDRKDLFSSAFAFATGGRASFDLASGGESRRISGAWVSGEYFTGLGVLPAAGRLVRAGDDFRGCPAVAALGYTFWQSEYGGQAAAVGKILSLDGHPFEIIGVAGPGFFGVDVGRSPQIYLPLCAEAIVRGPDSLLDRRSAWFLNVIGRPRPEVPAEQFRARLAAASREVFAATLPPDFSAGEQNEYLKGTLRFQEVAKGLSSLRLRYREALLVLMAVVGLVLLIACANVANLLLARATVRQREMAVRISIGAGRRRLVRQLLTESLLLSLASAALGIPFAHWGSRLLVSFFSTRANPTWLDLSVDSRVLAFTLAVAMATGILFGLVPAWQATRVDPQAAMKEKGRGIAEGSSRFSPGKMLVIGQIALSLVLVAVAGLLLGSFRRLATLDPGFRREGVLLISMDLHDKTAADGPRFARRRETLDRLRTLPGVRSASASLLTPVSNQMWNEEILVDGYSPRGPRDNVIWFNAVSDGFFSTLGSRIVLGRDFDGHEGPGSSPVAILNETAARRFFGRANPLGKSFRVSAGNRTRPPVEIIGVVADAKYQSLREENSATAYLPIDQHQQFGPAYSLELRTDGPVALLIPTLREELGRQGGGLSYTFTTLATQVDESLTRERLLATLSGFFGGLALLLAGIGLYGTVAYSVARRRHEIAIRLTLGALRARVLRMVLGEVGRMVGLGVVLGILLALATTRWVASFLFGLTASDPAVLALAAVTLAAVALVAGALPAWRAARLDPIVSLREE
ncbi:MAG TPA: ABC transporter permease [Thermoanaerobaculia bacterium]|jgi:predicted permease|nr:ABC transporter permease [Thermoanaerobaculia bacterium]